MKDEKKLVADEEKAKEERKSKRANKAPCTYSAPDPRTGRMRDYYPAVICSCDCAACGWNPEVKEKRVSKMMAEVEARRAAEAAKKRKAKKGGRK